MADPEMDEFAQTRGADDLFDDEIVPVSAEEQQVQTEIIAPELEPEPQQGHVPEAVVVEKDTSRGDPPQRGHGGERGRGRRGRGRGRGGRQSDQKRSESSSRKKKNADAPTADVRNAVSKAETPDGSKEQTPVEEGIAEEAEANSADAQRVPAVRGDRSATGGLRKVSRANSKAMRPELTFLSLNSPRNNFPSVLLQPRKML